jgi:PRTRC genetic system protein E
MKIDVFEQVESLKPARTWVFSAWRLSKILKRVAIALTQKTAAGVVLAQCCAPMPALRTVRVNEQIKYSNKNEVASVPEEAIKALTTPVSITGTAEDIDAKFPAILCEHVESHVQLQETLDRASAEIAEAVKQSTSGTSPRLMVRLPHDYCFFFIGANATDDFPFARVTGTNSPRAIGLRASS